MNIYFDGIKNVMHQTTFPPHIQVMVDNSYNQGEEVKNLVKNNSSCPFKLAKGISPTELVVLSLAITNM